LNGLAEMTLRWGLEKLDDKEGIWGNRANLFGKKVAEATGFLDV